MAELRAMEVVNALGRLGYVDKPASGDHVALFKRVQGHPDGPVTMKTGVDMGRRCRDVDITRIRNQTKLKDVDLWNRALAHKLSRTEYDDYLRGIPKEDLVNPWFREKVLKEKAGRARKVAEAARERRRRRRG